MKLSDTFPSTLDERVRRIVVPVRIVASEKVSNTDWLLTPHGGQSTIWSDPGAGFQPEAFIVLDFGAELHGSAQIVSLLNSGHRPQKLRVRFGESVSEVMGTPNNDHAVHDILLDAANMGTTECGMTAFRFIRIDNVDEIPCSIREICAVFLFRDCEYIGSFSCSDPLLNDVWTACARTVQLCMQEYLWDAPKRDRLIWMGDMHPEVCAIASAFGKMNVVERSLDLVRDETPLPRFMNGMLSYSISWMLCHYEWFRHFGDLNYLKKQHSYFRDLLDTLDQILTNDPGRIVCGGIIDWAHPENKGNVLCGAFHAYFIWTMQKFAELFESLKDKKYANRAVSMSKRAASMTGQTGNACSVHVHRVLSKLNDAVSENKTVFAADPFRGITPFQAYYLLQARALAGDFAGDLELIRGYWGGMLDLGSTTFWEHFDVLWLENANPINELPLPGKRDVHAECGAGCFQGLRNSFCHGWAAGPLPWLAENVLGFKIEEPGCRRLSLQPHLAGLTFAEGSFPTPFGPVQVSHRIKGGKLRTKILSCPPEVQIEQSRKSR